MTFKKILTQGVKFAVKQSRKLQPARTDDTAEEDDEVVDEEDDAYEEEDDDHLRDDIGASFSAAGGSTQNTSRSSNSGGSNEGVGGVVRGLFALRRKKKGRGEDQSMISQIVSKF